MEKRHLYPIYVNLDNKNCLVVGGGTVAQRKVENLLDYGAKITLVSPEVTSGILKYASDNIIEFRKRTFLPKDLEDIFMVFVCTNQSDINAKIADLCKSKGILVNAVDDPPNCDFFVPSILRRGSLSIAISTEGKSPMFARFLKEELEKLITDAYGEYVDLLGEQRELVKEKFNNIEKRKEIFADLVNSDILELFKAGEKEKARERVKQCISSWQD